jgi:ankyrin repeat protein
MSKCPNVGVTPLHIAAKTGDVDTCRLMMKYAKNKNPPKADGVTPLHSAALYGRL